MTTHAIAPDTTRRPDRPQPAPTHWHGYLWTGSGQEWERLGKADSLDLASPDRPPVRTAEWLRKSPRLLQGTWPDPAAARDWLAGEWEKVCEHALNPAPTGCAATTAPSGRCWRSRRAAGRRTRCGCAAGCWCAWRS